MSGVRGVLNYVAALPRQQKVETESTDGRLVCVMDWAPFTTQKCVCIVGEG